MIVRYLTHPQVRIDPAVPVPDWGLSDLGRQRTIGFGAMGLLDQTWFIVSSAEQKAIETAQILAGPRDLSVRVRPHMHENDRRATGFLPPPEFEVVADQFFASPDVSVRGWETARAAQKRIVAEFQAVLAAAIKTDMPGDILLVGHGGVGTLLLCHLAGLEISRSHDQPAGGGNLFSYDAASRRILHGWISMEKV